MESIKLSTEVNFKSSDWKFDYTSGIVTVGSCFAETLGSQLKMNKFSVLTNPFGTVFNPLSIARLLRMSLRDEMPVVGHYLVGENGQHLHYDFHSSIYSSESLEIYDKRLRTLMLEVKNYLKTAKVLVITLGTAFVYRLGKTGEVVANCHKAPAASFKRELLGVADVQENLSEVFRLLADVNPELRVVLTVSPVRHTRDTLPLNSVSKSVLRLAGHYLAEQFPHVSYFPAYEIVMDELRDYRFYEPDLIHPDSVAREHIYRNFVKAYLEKKSMDLMKEWTEVRMMIDHRPHQGYSESYRKHLVKTMERLRHLSDRLNVSEELQSLESILKAHYSSGVL